MDAEQLVKGMEPALFPAETRSGLSACTAASGSQPFPGDHFPQSVFFQGLLHLPRCAAEHLCQSVDQGFRIQGGFQRIGDLLSPDALIRIPAEQSLRQTGKKLLVHRDFLSFRYKLLRLIVPQSFRRKQ